MLFILIDGLARTKESNLQNAPFVINKVLYTYITVRNELEYDYRWLVNLFFVNFSLENLLSYDEIGQTIIIREHHTVFLCLASRYKVLYQLT